MRRFALLPRGRVGDEFWSLPFFLRTWSPAKALKNKASCYATSTHTQRVPMAAAEIGPTVPGVKANAAFKAGAFVLERVRTGCVDTRKDRRTECWLRK